MAKNTAPAAEKAAMAKNTAPAAEKAAESKAANTLRRVKARLAETFSGKVTGKYGAVRDKARAETSVNVSMGARRFVEDPEVMGPVHRVADDGIHISKEAFGRLVRHPFVAVRWMDGAATAAESKDRAAAEEANADELSIPEGTIDASLAKTHKAHEKERKQWEKEKAALEEHIAKLEK